MLNGAEKIEGLSEEQLEAVNKLAEGLSNKNKELLGKQSASNDSTVASEAELELLRKFKSSSEKQAAEDAENWKKVEELSNEAHAKEIEKLNVKGVANQELITTLLIDNGLSDQLDAININPALKAGAIAMLHSQCLITDGKAMIGDKSLSEAVKTWSETDTGKAYTLAANNNGTGSNGGDNLGAKGKWSDYSTAELSEIRQNKPEQYEQLKTTR